jgi:WD40 repeat protein
VRIWETGTGKEKFTLQHGAPVNAVTVSPDSQQIVTAGKDGTAKVWDANTGSQRRVFFQIGEVLRVALSPDRRYLVTTGMRSAILWDAQTGRLVKFFAGHTQGVYSPFFSHDGHSLVTSSTDGTARIWEIPSGRSLVLGTLNYFLNDAVLSPDGKYVATAVGNPVSIIQGAESLARVWKVKTQTSVPEPEYRGDGRPILFAAFSPGDAKYLVALDGSPTPLLFDFKSGKKTKLPGHFGEVTRVSFSSDGKFLLTSSKDGTVRVWDLTVRFQDLAQGTLAILPAPRPGRTHLIAQVFAAQGLVSPGVASPIVPQAAVPLGVAPYDALALVSRGAVLQAAFGPGNTSVLVIGESNTARLYTCEICGSLNDLAAAARKVLGQREAKPK